MNIDWYYSFLSVSKHLNYRKASDELFLAQPTVFQQIKNLEQSLGTILFEKDRRLIRLTNSGEFFVPIAKEFLNTYERGLQELQSKQNKFITHINVGVSSYIATYIIPKFLPLFFEKFPNVNVSISISEEGNSKELEEGNTDISISRKKPYSNKIKTEAVCEGKIKLIVPDVIETQGIKDEEFYFQNYKIFSNNHPIYWVKLEKEIYKLVPHAILTNVESVITTEKLIEANQGVSYLPTYVLSDEKINSIKIIEPQQIESPVSFTYLSTIKDKEEIQNFKNLFVQFIKNEQGLNR